MRDKGEAESSLAAACGLNRFARAIADKPKPEQGRKYRNKKTGAVLFWWKQKGFQGDYLTADYEDPNTFLFVARPGLERDWEPVDAD